MNKVRWWLWVLLLAGPVQGFTEEHHKDDYLEEDYEAYEEHKADDIQPLGKVVRLTFEITPAEKEVKPMSVITATTAYGISLAMSDGEEEGFHFNVEGFLKLVELPGLDRPAVGLTFETHLEGKNPKGGMEFHARGSNVVPLDGTRELARVGDKALTVKVTEVPLKP